MRCKKALILLGAILLLAAFSACSKEPDGPTPEQLAAAQAAAEAAAEAATTPKEETNSLKIESILDPEFDLQHDQEFLNELEAVNNELLLPLSVKVPNVVPTNINVTMYLGKDFNISPNYMWTVVTGSNSISLYHPSNIAVQLVNCTTGGKFGPDEITEELKTFYDSFIEKSEPVYYDSFIDKTLSGKEVSFVVNHNGRPIRIRMGAVTKTKDVLIYSMSYYVTENETTTMEQLDNLINTLQNGTKKVTIK